MIKGHCECKRVRFELDGEINDFSHCHCSQCRRLHGAAYATFAGVGRSDFRYVSGESDTSNYASSTSHMRVFCRECGSNIYVATDDEPEIMYLSMSTIEGNPPCPPGYHIYVGSKAPWHEIVDDLPQYEDDGRALNSLCATRSTCADACTVLYFCALKFTRFDYEGSCPTAGTYTFVLRGIC